MLQCYKEEKREKEKNANKMYNKFREEEVKEDTDPVNVGETTTNILDLTKMFCTCGKSKNSTIHTGMCLGTIAVILDTNLKGFFQRFITTINTSLCTNVMSTMSTQSLFII